MKKVYLRLSIAIFIVIILGIGFSSAENIMINADKQTFKGEKTTFEGNVKVDYEDITVKSPRVVVKNDKEGKPETATFFDGAHAVRTSGLTKNEVKANIINLSLLNNRITALGGVESSVIENQIPTVHITANTQEYDIKKNVIVATNNVKIKYKDILTNSRKARISINSQGNLDKVELVGNVKVNQDKNIINANEVLYNPVTNEVVATGNSDSSIFLDNGDEVKIWADLQQFDNASKSLITSGHVKIKYQDYIANGPKAAFLPDNGSSKPNKISFIGRSKIQEGQRYVEADRIQITVNPKNFTAEGNVKTRFSQVKSFKELNSIKK